MKQKLRTIMTLFIGILGFQAKAELRSLNIEQVQDISGKYQPEALSLLSRRGLLYLLDGSNRVYLNGNTARKYIQNPEVKNMEPSTIDLLKDLLGNSTVVSKKPLDSTVLGTQDFTRL